MEISGDQIRAARERRGWTQEQLARRLKGSMRTVGHWERGATVPLNRRGAIWDLLISPNTDTEPGLHSCSDAELLAEIARRFDRGSQARATRAESRQRLTEGDGRGRWPPRRFR